MQLLRSRLTGSHVLCELAARFAEMLWKTTPRPSKFIADSSPIGNKAGMRHREDDAKQHASPFYLCPAKER